MRAGGATVLTQAGASVELIQGTGHWLSNAAKQYIQKNVVVLHAHALHSDITLQKTNNLLSPPGSR